MVTNAMGLYDASDAVSRHRFDDPDRLPEGEPKLRSVDATDTNLSDGELRSASFTAELSDPQFRQAVV